MDKIKNLIEMLNNVCEENQIYDIDFLPEEIYEQLKEYDFKLVATLDRDEYRWHVLANNVYSVCIDGTMYFIGVWEVETLKSESMSISDCENILNFCEMEEFTTVSYRVKDLGKSNESI